MDTIKLFVVTVSVLLLGFGACSLVAAWCAPKVLERPLMRLLITGPRLAPTRSNQSVMAVWSILFAAYMLSWVLGYRTISLIFFGLWSPFAFLVLKLHSQAKA